MEWVVHTGLVHSLNECSYRLGHHEWVGALDGDDYIVEVDAVTHFEVLHTALYHTTRSIAIPAHNPIGEGSVVDAYPECGMVCLAVVEEGLKIGLKCLYLCSVLFVGEADFLKSTSWVVEVAWVDPYFLYMECGFVGCFGIEVNVG